MSNFETTIRVRYSETDQMGTFYNSRVLEWFEVGRTELLRYLRISYADMEARGAFLPVIEAHVKYLGRARYDDELKMSVSMRMTGKARVRFDVEICHANADEQLNDASRKCVASGYTVHAIVDASGKPIRTPQWFTDVVK